MSYSPATPANIPANACPPFATPPRSTTEDCGDGRAATRELAAWLSALPSFLVVQNHPLGDDELTRLAERNYIHETRILKQALRRCLHLSFVVGAEPREVAGTNDNERARSSLSFQGGFTLTPDAIRAVRESLCEIYGACCALAWAKRIDQIAWSGLCGSTRRALGCDASRAVFAPPAPDNELRLLLPDVHALLESAAPTAGEPERAHDLSFALSLFARALDQLALVAAWLRDDRPLKMTLPVFAHVHECARSAVSSLERIALRAAEGKGDWYELCDGAGYAVRMELNKVFRRELVGLAASRHPSTIFSKVENSHGLLRDCFQQTIISLARALDPNFDGEKLFGSLRAKLSQSLELRRELWALSESVRRAERDGDRKPLAPLVARLRQFESGAMRHLMYKDWESFERFVAEVTAARGAVELVPVLHRFATYLDALFNQINMRAVLADHPFDFTLVPD